MQTKPASLVPWLIAALLLLLIVWGWLMIRNGERGGNTVPGAAPALAGHADEGADANRAEGVFAPDPAARDAEVLRAGLKRTLERRNARAGEALLTFKDVEAYRNFLARAKAAGLAVIGSNERLLTVRVGFGNLDGLGGDILGHGADYSGVAANTFVDAPKTPAAEERAGRVAVPVGNTLLETLGVTGDRSEWGRGVTIAVIDSGVAADVTLGNGRLRVLDIGMGIAPSRDAEGGHGTAVASLAAGAAVDAPGVAPAANVLSIRVTANDGRSDMYSLADAIVRAVDAGARVLNVSLGAYETGAVLTRAIDYAYASGAVLVAAAGNDQAAQLMWPAADARAISVGAVDAVEQQAMFSNSGEQLKISAPGVSVQTAWLNGQRVYFSGTSASAPVVAGAIAAVMSQSPGLSAAQAWEVLRTHASDAGAPGQDPDFGNGALNLGWAMARNQSARVDTAISSHYYDASARMIDVVVQNRSATAVTGATLDVEINGASTRQTLPLLKPGGSAVIVLPVPASGATGVSALTLRTKVTNPAGSTDAVPGNNRKASTLRVR